jgi:response regulator RpfG family c-di-GMP phosphodiesterase
MNTSRLIYRSRQFWKAIKSQSSQEDLELVTSILAPLQLRLFQRMQPSEQAHSIRIVRELMIQGVENSDLLTAALLHDVGKIRTPYAYGSEF